MSLSAYDITAAPFTTRPVIQGRFGVVSSGHYLASEISLRILNAGGNAVDAGVAGVLALTVLKPQSCGIGGRIADAAVAPTGRGGADKLPNPLAINGQGTAPRAATIEWFRSQGIDMIPGDGLLATTVPATFDACIEALRVGGRLSIVDVLEPAVELAREGFAVYPSLREADRPRPAHLSRALPEHGLGVPRRRDGARGRLVVSPAGVGGNVSGRARRGGPGAFRRPRGGAARPLATTSTAARSRHASPSSRARRRCSMRQVAPTAA